MKINRLNDQINPKRTTCSLKCHEQTHTKLKHKEEEEDEEIKATGRDEMNKRSRHKSISEHKAAAQCVFKY